MMVDSNSKNPYQAPQSDFRTAAETPVLQAMRVSEETLAQAAEELDAVKLWTWVSALASFSFLLLMMIQSYFVIQEWAWEVYIVPVIVSFIFGLFYVACSLQSMDCYNAITSFLEEPSSLKLADYFYADARFWKVVGGLCVTGVGVMAAVAIFLIFF